MVQFYLGPALHRNIVSRNSLPVCIAIAGVLAVIAWQWAAVHFLYSATVPGSFVSATKNPAHHWFEIIAAQIPTALGSTANFLYLASDPCANGIQRYLRCACARAHRILLPALAWVLAFRRPSELHCISGI